MKYVTMLSFTGGIYGMKSILILSHCILNTASKVKTDESDLAEEYKLKSELLHKVLDNDIQMLQLPCPEFLMYGSHRWGHVRNQFDNPFYKNASKEMLNPFMMQIEEYASHPDEFNILGIVSVEGSPSCGYKLTCTGKKWCGELGSDPDHIADVQNSLEMKNEPGMFMQIIQKELKARSLSVPILTMNEAISLIS